MDKPYGTGAGTLGRAVVVAHSELAGEWISVNTGADPLWIRRVDLSFQPPPGDNGALAKAYVDDYRRRRPGADARLSVKTESTAAEPAMTTLETRVGDDHFLRYAYRVTDSATAKPETMWRVFGPGWAIEGSSPGLAALIATGVAGVFAFGLARLWRPARRKLAA